MNAETPISHDFDGNMTSKGQVLIPKPLRELVGLVLGGPVRVSVNDRGEVVVAPRPSGESYEERRARIRKALDAARGSMDTGGLSTNDYMALIRPRPGVL